MPNTFLSLLTVSVTTRGPAMAESLKDYPQWLVVACGAVVAALVIWIVAKLLKWTLWLLLVAVLVGGGVAAVWLLFN